jgi:SAM-dependent methyltransferase
VEPGAYDELNALEATHWWYEGMRRITHCLLNGLLHNQNDLLILDAGCGAGGNLTALSSLGTVLGIDYSPLALQYAAPDHVGRLARASIDALPFPDSYFDLVIRLMSCIARKFATTLQL